MKRLFSLAVIMTMAVISAWAGYFSPAFVSSDAPSVNNETPKLMFDGIYNTSDSKWCANTQYGTWKGCYFIMDARTPMVLNGYRLIGGGDNATHPERRWKAWRIEGSNSSDPNGEWTEVDKKTNSPTSSDNYGVSDYTTTATKAYRYYKIIVDENVSGDLIQMSEILIAGTAPIATPADLVNLATAVNSGSTAINAKLTANIDMTETAWNTPIGISDARYIGTFDGDGYVIKNLHGSYTADRHGLVGFGNGGMVIKNLIVDGATIHGLHQAAVICGRMNTGASTISNCAVIGEVKVTQQDAAAPSVAVIANACGSDKAELSIVGCYTTSTLPIASSWGTVGYTTTRCYNDVNNNEGLATGKLCNDLNGGTVGPWLQTIGEDAYPVLRAGNVVGGVDMAWTKLDGKTGYCGSSDCITIAHDRLNNTWGWNATLKDVTGYSRYGGGSDIGTMAGSYTSTGNSKLLMSTIYEAKVDIPSYSKLERTATFNLYFATSGHWNSGGLYLFDTEDAAKNTAIDGTWGQSEAKPDNCIVKACNKTNDGVHYSYPGTFSMTFENGGDTDGAMSKYLTFMHVIGLSGNGTVSGKTSWATFNTPSYVDTWSYGNVITFDANNGTGTMANQTIWAAGTLTANTLTRDGYNFTGWNTQADGKGTAYTNEQAITVTSTTKGAITLYAQWEASAAPTAIDTPAAQKAQKIIKTIENGRVVIIRDGEKYDITGRKL